ncbi:hypothetical protein [Methylomonas sp. 11b]|uniref:hypothetical protein n=1 Tax=Methylomonas sp. 11b TaxID=1168169 RepID=UPI00047E3165|nr:hypothetical protein [Methylomonas sp. 11b]
MSEILQFKHKNAAIDPDVVLQEAQGNYESVIVIGFDKHEALDCRASLNLSQAEIHWMVSVFMHKLLAGDYSADDD